jgi:hypothetical protein
MALCPTKLMITPGTLQKPVGRLVEALHCRGLEVKSALPLIVPPGITQQIGYF